MLYSEFIELSGFNESLINYGEYKECIEPIYMENECIDKIDFVAALIDAIDEIAVRTVVKAISQLSKTEKANCLTGRGKEAEEIREVFAASRKVEYNFLRIILGGK